MQYMAHESMLNTPSPDGSPTRAHYEKLARHGDQVSIDKLKPPEYPEWIDYLREWAVELHGRSGVGMGGYAPLTYTTIADWSRLNRVPIDPEEVRALMQLDAAMLYPDKLGKSE
jgi:hypothetical protein